VTALLDPEVDQLAEAQARRLVEVFAEYANTLELPEEVATLRTIAAEALLEVAMLRLDLRRLSERVEALERRGGAA
jgi:hypothetical protein